MLEVINKRPHGVYFRRDNKTYKEVCFVGKKIVNKRVFFFFYDLGVLQFTSQYYDKKHTYYNMGLMRHKLEEYLSETEKTK